MKKFEIIETNLVNGNTRRITELKHDCRGWSKVTKIFKSERSAKAWITRRMKEVIANNMYNPVYTIEEI